jgi:hypothetical protein
MYVRRGTIVTAGNLSTVRSAVVGLRNHRFFFFLFYLRSQLLSRKRKSPLVNLAIVVAKYNNINENRFDESITASYALTAFVAGFVGGALYAQVAFASNRAECPFLKLFLLQILFVDGSCARFKWFRKTSMCRTAVVCGSSTWR